MSNSHLSRKEIYSLIIEPESADANVRSHLDGCRKCREELHEIERFTESFHEQIERTEIDWTREKGEILSKISACRSPVFTWRWSTAVVLPSILLLLSVFLVRMAILQPDKGVDTKNEDVPIQFQMASQVMAKQELPESVLLLTEWEEEDFSQLLDFLVPIKEEDDEKVFINEDLSDNRIDRSLFA